jgi:hypothetical protein
MKIVKVARNPFKSTDIKSTGGRHHGVTGDLTIHGLIGQLVANDTKVSRDTLIQLFCLSSSGLIGSRYEYERTRISG